MGVFQDQDAVPESEAIDENEEKNVGKNGELRAHLLGNEVKSSTLEKSVTLPSAGFGYNANKRPYRDGAFSMALVAVTTATICVGIFAAFNHNSDFFRVRSARFENSVKGCTVNPAGFLDAPRLSISKSILLALSTHTPALYGLLASLILGAPAASGLLWVLRKHTKKVVLAVPVMLAVLSATIALVPVSCVLRRDGCQLHGTPIRYIIRIVFACLVPLLMWINWRANWESTKLSIRVIRTASEVLHKNMGLLLVLPAVRMTFLLYYVPIAFSLLLAYANGRIVLIPKLFPYQDRNLEAICTVLNESCCVWKTDRWVPAYIILAIFATLWLGAVFSEVEMFSISGTISQWYFGAALNSTRVNLGAVNRSVRQALGPSLGTVCFAGLVYAPSRIFGGATQNCRKRNRMSRLIRGCILSVLPCLEFMTNFTTDFAAVTGEGFDSSAKMACDLLKRNFLSTTVADSSPRRLLYTFAFLSSALSGVVVWVVLNLFVQNWAFRWQIGYFALILLFLVLFNCIRILVCVVDSLYICYAIDKDNCEVFQPTVHDAYALLPPRPDCDFGPVADSKMTP